MKTSTILKLALLAIAIGSSAAVAHAGEWRLNPAACPDLREDRIDRKKTTSRRDLREDLRDMRKIECPASAWTYVPAKGERKNIRRVYSGPTIILVGKRGYYRAPVHLQTSPALIKIIID